MLILCFKADGYACFIFRKKILNIAVRYGVSSKIPDIFIREINIDDVNLNFFDRLENEKIFFYDYVNIFYVYDKYKTFIYGINKLPRSVKGIRILYHIQNILNGENGNTKYNDFRLAYKLFEIGSFIFLRKNINKLTDDSYIVIVPSIDNKNEENNVHEKIASLIEKYSKYDIYSFYFINYTIMHLYDNINYCNNIEYKVVNIPVFLPKILTLANKILSKGFVTIMSNNKAKLDIKVLNKKQIDIIEIKSNTNKDVNISKPIHYNISVEDFISKILSGYFDLNSTIEFIKLVHNHIDKYLKAFDDKYETVKAYFYSILGISILHSNDVKKIYSAKFFLDEVMIAESSIVYFVTELDIMSLLDSNSLLLPSKLESIIIRNYVVTVDFYKFDLNWIGKGSTFIFPFVRISKYKKDNLFDQNLVEQYEQIDFTKTFEFEFLGKKFSSKIHIYYKEDRYRVDPFKKLKIEVKYNVH